MSISAPFFPSPWSLALPSLLRSRGADAFMKSHECRRSERPGDASKRVECDTAMCAIKRALVPKSLVRFKRRVREITRRAKGISIDATMTELVSYMRGWRSYFGFCETPRVLAYLTSWVRARLRVALWRQWKTPRRRRAALLELGVRPKLASNTAGSSRGPWYLAHAKALSVALPTAYFKSLGLPNLEDAS